MKTSKPILTLSVALGLAFSASSAQALVLTETDTTGNSFFTVSTTDDLILGQLADNSGTAFSAIDTTTDADTTQAQFNAELTNGSTVTQHQTQTDAVNVPLRSGFAGIFNATVLTYALPSASDITEIDTYSSWGDPGRSQQNYTLSYSVDNGLNYIDLNIVDSATAPFSQTAPGVVKVALTGVLLAATDIRFSFGNVKVNGVIQNPVENGAVGYSEFAVYGTPTLAPEPQTWSLLGFGLLGLGFLARRKLARA